MALLRFNCPELALNRFISISKLIINSLLQSIHNSSV